MGASEETQNLLQDEETATTTDMVPAQRKPHCLRLPSARCCMLVLSAMLLCSLAANLYQCIQKAQERNSQLVCQTKYSGLGFGSKTVYQDHTDFQSEKNTIADDLWDALDTGAIAMAIPDSWASQHALPYSERFPWDDDKGMYFVKGLHQMHCLKLLRHGLISFYRYSRPVIPERHLMHCLDSLRQDVMCYADDSPMAAPPGQQLGHDQTVTCRDWDAMVEWARQPLFESCWAYADEYQTIEHRIERYQFCRPDSPYYAAMQRYFEAHGHQQMYKENPV